MLHPIKETGPILSWYIQKGQTRDLIRLGDNPNVLHIQAYHPTLWNRLKTVAQECLSFTYKDGYRLLNKIEYCKALCEYVSPNDPDNLEILEKIKKAVDRQLELQPKVRLTEFSRKVIQQVVEPSKRSKMPAKPPIPEELREKIDELNYDFVPPSDSPLSKAPLSHVNSTLKNEGPSPPIKSTLTKSSSAGSFQKLSDSPLSPLQPTPVKQVRFKERESSANLVHEDVQAHSESFRETMPLFIKSLKQALYKAAQCDLGAYIERNEKIAEYISETIATLLVTKLIIPDLEEIKIEVAKKIKPEEILNFPEDSTISTIDKIKIDLDDLKHDFEEVSEVTDYCERIAKMLEKLGMKKDQVETISERLLTNLTREEVVEEIDALISLCEQLSIFVRERQNVQLTEKNIQPTLLMILDKSFEDDSVKENFEILKRSTS